MSITTTLSDDQTVMNIVLPERFNFDVHSELRQACKDNKKIKKFILNLKNTNYIDSSALGMILQLKEQAGDTNDSVQIVNANGNVKEILEIANFDKIIKIN